VTRPKDWKKKNNTRRTLHRRVGPVLSPEDNWTSCNSSRCRSTTVPVPDLRRVVPISGTGHDEVYRPTFRSELFRRIYKNSEARRKLLAKLKARTFEVNAPLRLLESSLHCRRFL